MIKKPIVKALLYHHPENEYQFKAKGIESTSSKYEYLINKTGATCRKYFQRRSLSRHLLQQQEKARYYQTIGDQEAHQKALNKFRHLESHGINKLIESGNWRMDHKPALQSLMISLGYDVPYPEAKAYELFYLWCVAHKQKSYEWDFYAVYHQDTTNPHFHIVIYESPLKRPQRILKAKTLYRFFSKPKLKKFKDLVGCQKEAASLDGIEINIDILKMLHQKIIKLQTMKEQKNRNLLKIFLNLIGMKINQLKTYDAIYTNLCHNKRDDLVLPQSIKKSKYFEQYLAIRPDALTCSVGIIKKEYKQLKQAQYIKEMQIYLEAIKNIEFNENMTIYCQQLELEFWKILNQLSQNQQDYQAQILAQKLQAIEQLTGQRVVNSKQLDVLFGFDKKLIQPVDQTKLRKVVRIR